VHYLDGNLSFFTQHDLQVAQMLFEWMGFVYPPPSQPRKCSTVFLEGRQNLSFSPV